MLKYFSLVFISVIIPITMDSCHKHGAGYNPYLHMKTKPSQQQNQENTRILSKRKKAYTRQLGDSRKRIFGRRKPPKE